MVVIIHYRRKEIKLGLKNKTYLQNSSIVLLENLLLKSVIICPSLHFTLSCTCILYMYIYSYTYKCIIYDCINTM